MRRPLHRGTSDRTGFTSFFSNFMVDGAEPILQLESLVETQMKILDFIEKDGEGKYSCYKTNNINQSGTNKNDRKRKYSY